MTTEIPLAGVGEDGRHLYTCPLCEAMCGLDIDVRDGRVTGIRGNRDDTWSRGHLCPKGATLGALHEDPDRIRRPMIKVDGQWQEVSWDVAFRRCTELLAPVIAEHGIGAVTAYVGNPLAHSFSLARYSGVLLGMSGMPITYSPGTVDQWPKNLSSHLMFGGWWTFPVPDIERTDLLVVMGANPAASQGSLLAAPNVMGIIDDIRRRGRVVVVDPVRTATAARADEWLPITPGTDAALLLAVVHTLFAEDLVSLGAVGAHVDGLDALRAAVADWTPQRVAPATGIDAERIRMLARELATTARAVVYGRIGLCNQEFGSLASWLVDVVNILTGHFDVPGGAMFPRAAAWSITVQPQPGLEDGAPEFGRFRTRVRGAKEVLGQVPVSCLAEEIATPGDGQVRALITVAGNPVLSTPAGHRLDEVLPGLDAMISVDLWLNETTRHADVLLPGLSPLEQPHHDDLILNFAINSIANYSPPVFFPDDPERPHEWEILIRLTGLLTGTPAEDVDVAAIDDGFFDYMAFTQGLDGATVRALYSHGGPERVLDLTLRTGPFGDRYGENPDGLTLDKLKEKPNGVNFGPMVPQIPDILGTADHRIRLAPQYLLDDLPRLAARLTRTADDLVLVSRRHLRSNNSWLHNVGALIKGRDRCTLLMHRTDAARCGVHDGDLVTVTPSGGSIEVPVEVTEAIKPGVVSMPHGWGHGRPGTRMTVANAAPGVNTNVLSPPMFLDEPSGNGALNGIPVTVAPAGLIGIDGGKNERAKIVMSDDEIAGFIERSRTATLATVLPSGRPHLVAMWYAVLDGEIWFETKAKSQKAVNLRRDPTVTVMIEDGLTYNTLRGVSIDGRAEIVDADPDLLLSVGISVWERYTGPYTDEVKPFVEQMMHNRIAVRVVPERIRSWDHRKLGMPEMPVGGSTAQYLGQVAMAAPARPKQLDSPLLPTIFKYVGKAHVWVYRRTGGRIGGKWRVGARLRKPVPTMLLEHRGRKSGRVFVTPLLYLRDGANVVIVASQGGRAEHPQWYRNLVANPDVFVEIGSERRPVRAVVADAAERARLWPRLVELYADFDTYQSWAEREIPVIVLQPR